MPAINFEPVDHCVLARIWWSLGNPGPEMIMTLNFHAVPLDPDEADCLNVAAFVDSWVHTSLLPIVGDASYYNQTECFSRHSATGATATASTPGAGTGGVNNAGDSSFAPLIVLKTGRRGRSYFGKSYTVPPPAASIAATGYAGAYMAALGAKYVILKAAAETAGYPLCVASAKVNAVTDVTNFETTSRLTMQKRRRPGFGR